MLMVTEPVTVLLPSVALTNTVTVPALSPALKVTDGASYELSEPRLFVRVHE
jgi:hypothetical protein